MGQVEDYQQQALAAEVASIRSEVARLRRNSGMIVATVTLFGTNAATAANYGVFFIAPVSCQVVEAWATWQTAGSSTPTLTIERLTSGQALDAGSVALTSSWSLNGLANDPRRIRGASASRYLNQGDRLALRDSGTLTSVAYLNVTVLLRASSFALSAVDNP